MGGSGPTGTTTITLLAFLVMGMVASGVVFGGNSSLHNNNNNNNNKKASIQFSCRKWPNLINYISKFNARIAWFDVFCVGCRRRWWVWNRIGRIYYVDIDSHTRHCWEVIAGLRWRCNGRQRPARHEQTGGVFGDGDGNLWSTIWRTFTLTTTTTKASTQFRQFNSKREQERQIEQS